MLDGYYCSTICPAKLFGVPKHSITDQTILLCALGVNKNVHIMSILFKWWQVEVHKIVTSRIYVYICACVLLSLLV